MANALPERIGYEQAAKKLCVSDAKLRNLISEGELPVIQPAAGQRPALIEVAAINDLLDKWRVRAQRDATRRAKSAAAKRGAA